MPTYEYQCKSCTHRFEIWQKMADEALTVCPECQGVIRRVLYPAGIVFKGSGFYKTDHGSGAVINESNHDNQSDKNKDNAAKKETGGESKTGTNSKKNGTGNKKTVAASAGSDNTVAAAD